MSDSETPSIQDVNRLVDEMRFCMQGRGQFLQGAALVDLVAMYFAGHPPVMREEAITIWIDAMRSMIPVNEERLFEHYGGMPESWKPQ
jgi:hypothetical protein